MKKNGILITILFSLLTLTYFVKEKRIFSNDQLISNSILEQLNLITLDDDILERQNESWIIKSYQLEASKIAIKHFLLILKELQIEETLVNNQSSEVLHQLFLSTPDEKLKLVIHSISPITGRIVLSMNNKAFLVSMNHFIKGVFKNDQALYNSQINEFRSFLETKNSFLKENYFTLDKNVKTVTIKTGNPVKLDLIKNMTEPEVLPGLNYSLSIRTLMQDYLNLIKTTEILLEEIVVKKVVSQIYTDDVLWLTLFEKDTNDQEVYLRDEKLKKVFVIKKDSSQVFFIQAKDFWEKQIFKENRLEDINQLSLVLKDNKLELEFEVPSTKTFIIKSKNDTKPNTTTLTELFKILFAIDDYQQAYKVSHVDSNIDLKNGFKVKVLDKELYFWLSSSFIHVLDIPNSLLFTFVNSSQIIKENTINQFKQGI